MSMVQYSDYYAKETGRKKLFDPETEKGKDADDAIPKNMKNVRSPSHIPLAPYCSAWSATGQNYWSEIRKRRE
jgi:hypothetical protein